MLLHNSLVYRLSAGTAQTPGLLVAYEKSVLLRVDSGGAGGEYLSHLRPGRQHARGTAFDPGEFIHVPDAAEATLSSPKDVRVSSTELPTPLSNGLVGDYNPSLCQQIFNISQT